MYAIVKVGGKQYRVEKGDTLVVDRMPDAEGDKVTLEPLLFRSDKTVFEGADLGKVKVEAVVTGHERGKKIRVVKFKPKRGYKRTNGHRSELTRLEIKDIKMGASRGAAAKPEAKASSAGNAEPASKASASGTSAGGASAKKTPAAKASGTAAAKKPAARASGAAAAKKPAAKKPAAKKPAAKKPAAPKKDDDGS